MRPEESKPGNSQVIGGERMEKQRANYISRRERKKLLLSQLKNLSSEIITDPEKLEWFADKWRSGFHSYSISNLILIWWQCHNFSLVAGFNQWRKVRRYVKRGSTAIWILAPMIQRVKVKDDEDPETEEEKVIRGFFPVPVFDYSQTEGNELEIGNICVSGNDNLSLEVISKIFKIPVKFSQGIEDGRTDGKTIWISERKNKAQEISAYFHELAHVLLSHCDNGSKLSKEDKELEAECTAYIISKFIGLNNEGSKYYIGKWGADPERIKKHSLKIIACANKILRKLEPVLDKVEITQRGAQASLF